MPDNSGSSESEAGFVCRGAAGTAALARRVAAVLKPGDVVLLDGPLGAGKTTFASELVAALGIADAVTSPTYTLVHHYGGRSGISVDHVDLYRVETLAEVEDLGLDFPGSDAILVVEWGGVARAAFGEDRLEIEIGYGPHTQPTTREVRVRASGASWVDRFAALEQSP